MPTLTTMQLNRLLWAILCAAVLSVGTIAGSAFYFGGWLQKTSAIGESALEGISRVEVAVAVIQADRERVAHAYDFWRGSKDGKDAEQDRRIEELRLVTRP